MHRHRFVRLLAVTLALSFTAGSPAAEDVAGIEILVPSLDRAVADGATFVGHLWDDEGRRPADVELRLDGDLPGVALLSPCAPGSILTVESASFAIRPIDLTDDVCAGTAEVRTPLLKVVRVPLPVSMAQPDYRPIVLRVAMRRCPTGRGFGEQIGVFPVLLEAGEQPVAALPAAECVDVALHAPGFADEVWFGVDFSAAAPVLQARQLSTGASVFVLVTEAQSGAPCRRCAVTLLSREHVADAVAGRIDPRWVGPGQVAATNDRGWALLRGLAPGSLMVLAIGPGSAPAIAGPVELVPGASPVVELALEKPGTLSLGVDTEAPIPEDLGIDVVLTPMLDCSVKAEAAHSARLATDGSVRFEGIMPGFWRADVVATRPDGRTQLLGAQEVEVLPGGETTAVIPIRATWLVGLVTYRDEPLAAELTFNSQDGPPTSPASAHADAEGRFSVLLAHGGTYSVDVASARPSLRTSVPDIEVELEEELAIEVPEMGISGVTVDEDGDAIANALVTAASTAEAGTRHPTLVAETRSAADGSFELAGLSAGTWRVEASAAPDLKSRPRSEVLLPETSIEIGRITLRRTGELSGLVSFRGAAVPDALVILTPTDSDSITLTRTDAAGRFTLQVPASIRSSAVPAVANVQVVAPVAFPSAAFRLPLKEPLQIDLGSDSGSLLIQFSDRAWERLSVAQSFLVHEWGGILALQSLAATGAAAFQGASRSIAIPSVMTGRWRLVAIPSPFEVLSLLASPSTAPALATFDVGAGAETTVEIEDLTGAGPGVNGE